MTSESSICIIDALKEGLLGCFRERVIRDHTLDMEIRREDIRIYYRGGRILYITAATEGYKVDFDKNYFIKNEFVLPNGKVKNENDANEWVVTIPKLKQAMDLWLCHNPKEEREFQQLVVRENNYSSIAKGTDYFICDIEYVHNKNKSGQNPRFDLIAAHWPSTPAARKDNTKVGLAIIEIKYGEGAIGGAAGILKHIEDYEMFIKNNDMLRKFKDEMENAFNNKRKLGLIDSCKKDIMSFNNEAPDLILMFANHDPATKALKDAINKVRSEKPNTIDKIKFATANYFGCGLYDNAIYALNDFEKLYLNRI